MSRPDPLRLTARPHPPHAAGARGPTLLVQAGGRPALLQVPASYEPARPLPLVVMLHGSGGDPAQAVGLLREVPPAEHVIVLAPASRDYTWDAVLGAPGPDVKAIDALLEVVFTGYAVDPARIALGGFSDGASCALALGLANGDVVTHVLAFSPGFIAGARREGRPQVFVSHGRADAVLPIDACSRRIVATLERVGYAVDYHEFADGHAVPRDIAADALATLARGA
jgi:phospholipase/carboxylesterase